MQFPGFEFDFQGVQDYFYTNINSFLAALLLFVISVVVLKIFKYVIVDRLRKLSKKTKNDLDDLVIEIIDGVGWSFYLLVSIYVASMSLVLPPVISNGLYYLFLIVLTYHAIRAIQQVIDYAARRLMQKRRKEEKDADTSLIDILAKVAKGVLWAIALMLVLQNMGYDISALIAGLGIGGLAIAIALQNILSDIFASFSIYFDKPFQKGDFIIVGSDMGVVRHVGIQTTRLESLWGQEIVISNKELVSSRINNYKKMEKRRIQFAFGVLYETPSEKLEKALGIVKDIFAKIDSADLDRVHFKSFGDFSLNYEVVYYVDSGDYNKYMDIQQQVNFALKKRFEEEGIDFAYPTQTILMGKTA